LTSIEPGIVTNDANALAAFYFEALGFEVIRSLSLPQGEVRRLVRGSARFKIYQPTDLHDAQPQPGAWFQRSGWAYAALHTDDAVREVELVRSAGGTIITEVTNHRPGAQFALIADPEGNTWEILEEVP
jgi:catechol 2,3-dioxygenase-like lactoylglutathione lyase family enzyme